MEAPVRSRVTAATGKASRLVAGKRTLPYLLIAPALVGTIFVHVIPIIWGIFISFRDLDIYTIANWRAAPFTGLANYVKALDFADPDGLLFLRSVGNVTYYGVVTITLGYVIGLAVALLLNQRFFGRTLVRGLVLLPYIMPDSVAYSVWRFIFQARVGIVNGFLMSLGIIKEPLVWLVGTRTMFAVMVASIWKGWPFASLLLLAGLQSVPRELLECAAIDGANRWQRFRYVMWPHILPVTKTLILLNILWNFNAYNQFKVMLGDDPGVYAEVPSTFVVRQAFDNLRYGLGAAMSVVLVLMMTVVAVIYLRTLKPGTSVED
ncbi:MAG: sugar ABC transporter permease [Firmicutes bacterium]|jgi:multiple sugar transport system permease protein|nr:sugar ABC transporter permease [Bacillota bacterium]MDH7496294.1 sugar ABC transporter permease [Bacillota bacterium]